MATTTPEKSEFLTTARRYVLDKIVLSVARLLPVVVLLFGLNEVLGSISFASFVPVFSFDNTVLNAIGILLIGLLIAVILQALAENNLDPERIAHRTAYQQIAPRLQAEKQDLTTKLKETRETNASLAKELDTERNQHAVQKTTNQNTLDQLAKTQAELDQTKTKLNDVQFELFEALEDAKSARAQQTEAQTEAATVQSAVYRQMLNEVDTLQTSLSDYRQQIEAKYKAANRPQPATNNTEPTTAEPQTDQPSQPTNTPPVIKFQRIEQKENYV